MARHRARHIILWTLLLLLLAALLWLGRLTVSHGTPQPVDDSVRTLRVLTYNTQRMGGFEKPEQNRVLQYILRTDADIVCLQEVEVYQDNQYLTLGELRDAMQAYPYCYFAFSVHNNRRQFGNAVFSKYPILDRENVDYASRSNSSCRCDIVVEDDTLRLFCNHLESYRFNADSLRDSTTMGSLRRLYHMLPSLRGKGRGRTEQAQAVRDEINRSPYPVLVVGDFNDTPVSASYRIIAEGLTDAFLSTSWLRWGTTFRMSLSMVGRDWIVPFRIDYILCSPELTPMSCTVDTVRYSDHYPLQATIALPAPK